MNRSPAPALTQGLDIIELIAQTGQMGFNNIAEATGISVSTLNRILKVLVEKAYLVKHENGKYMLGSKLFTMTKSESIWSNVLEIAGHILKELSDNYCVTALLFEHGAENIIALDKVTNIDSVNMQPTGYVNQQFTTRPWGFLHMVNQSDEVRKKLHKLSIENANPKDTVLSDDEINELIDFANENGYSDDYGRIKASIRRIAVPIKNRKGDVVSSLAVGFVNGDLDEKKIICLIEELLGHAKDLSLLISS